MKPKALLASVLIGMAATAETASGESPAAATRPASRAAADPLYTELPKHMLELVAQAHEAAAGVEMTAEQRAKVDAIFDRHRASLESMAGRMERGELSPGDAMKEAGRTEALPAEVGEVLDGEQKMAFARRLKPKTSPFPPAPPGAEKILDLRRTLGQLDLSEEQKPKADAVAEKFRRAVEEAQADFTSGRITAEQFRGRGRAAGQALLADLKEFLTPDQLRQLMGILTGGAKSATTRAAG